MLTWMGFVGKLIDLLINKLAGKKIDLALDEKKKAAKAFVRFHEAVVELEQTLANLLTYIETFKENRNTKIHMSQMGRRVTGNLNKASVEFVESLKDLGEVIYFYDYDLALLFAEIFFMKQGLLQNVYAFFERSVQLELEIESEYYEKRPKTVYEDEFGNKRILPVAKFTTILVDNSYCSIEYTIPDDTLMNLDFKEQFEQIVRSKNTTDFWERHRNMQKLQDEVFTIISLNTKSEFIRYEDKEKLIELYPKLKSHKELLTKAREGLREFIQKQFSLADVLYIIE